MNVTKDSTDVSVLLYIADNTDGTPETGVVYNTAGIDLKYRRDGAAATSITEATLAALTTAHTDGGFLEIGNGWYRFDVPDAAFATGVDKVLIYGTVTGMVVYGVVVELIESTVDANVTQISGDSSAADNLEAMYDGTGYANDDAPATQGQVSGIGSSSGAGFNFAATADNTGGAIIDGVTFVGSQTGTYSNTESNLATFHQIDDTANAIDIVYRIAAGATKTFIALDISAYVNGSNDSVTVQLYDHVGADWETEATIAGINGSAISEVIVKPLEKHTGALGTSEAGNLYVRFVCSAQSNPVLYVARIIGEAITSTSTMGYEAASVYVDEVGGTSTGTVQGVDGIFANQCDDFDNAQTIADNLGTATITNHPGNSITLTSALQGYSINNVQATLNGGSQNVDSTRVTGGFITGTWNRAGTGIPTFSTCNVLNVTSDRVAILGPAGIQGTFTISEAGFYPFVDCQAAGTTVPIIDFNSTGGATVAMNRWSGSITINNMASGDTLNLHCVSGGDVTINGVDGTVTLSGVIGTVTDNRTGSPTLNSDQMTQVAVADAIWDEQITTSAHNGAQSAGKNLRQAAGGLAVEAAVNDASATTTSFITDLTSAVDDFYNDSTLTFLDGALEGQSRVITNYNGTTKAITFDEALTSAPADTVTFQIAADHVHAVSQIQSGLATAANLSTLDTKIGTPADTSIAQDIANDSTFLDGMNTTLGEVLTDTGTTLPATLAIAQADLDIVTGTDGALVDSTNDVYHALIEYTFDDPEDEYTVTWFKNGERVTSGITSPVIQVVKRADGTDLVASTAMTQIGSTGSYKYDEASNVISVDESYLAITSATIDAGSRSFACLVGRTA